MMPNMKLFRLVPDVRRYIWGKVAVQWVSLAAGIALWFLFGSLLQALYAGQPLSLSSMLILLGCIALRVYLTQLASRLTHLASSGVKRKLRAIIFSKLCRLGGDYMDHFPTAEVVQLSGEGVEQLESYFGLYMPQFFYAMLAPLTLLLVFLPLSPLTGIVLFLCVPLIPVAIAKVQRFAKKMLGKYWDAYANLGDSFLENLQGLTTLKVYGADERRHEEMNKESEHFRVVTMKVLTMQLNSVTIMDFVAYGGTALGCILTARAFLHGQLAIGQAFAMVMLSSEFFLSMRALGSYFHTAMNGVAAAERMFRLMDLPEREGGTETARDGDLLLQHFSYSYDGTRNALEDINLQISKGSCIGLVGASGCGKSTLAALLSGQRHGYTGSATLGGVELSACSAESLRTLVTVVSTSNTLFAGTVADTLREGKPDATDLEMQHALETVSLWDFVSAQGGLSMRIAERGENLSGGQRQRLALARALLKDSPVYIFDEATSNIDADSEAVILDTIAQMRARHTVLLISHRMANVQSADCIFCLSQGKLVESGTHAALMAKNGEYARLVQAQQQLEQVGIQEVRT